MRWEGTPFRALEDVRGSLRSSSDSLNKGPLLSCFDNAMAESFFASLERELLERAVSVGSWPP